jgi:hypothetical protein
MAEVEAENLAGKLEEQLAEKTDADPRKVAEYVAEVVRTSVKQGASAQDAEQQAQSELSTFVTSRADARAVASAAVANFRKRTRADDESEHGSGEDGDAHALESTKRQRVAHEDGGNEDGIDDGTLNENKGGARDEDDADGDNDEDSELPAPPARPPPGMRNLEPPPPRRGGNDRRAGGRRGGRGRGEGGTRDARYNAGGRASHAQRTLTVLNMPDELESELQAKQELQRFFSRAGFVEDMFVNIEQRKAHVRLDSHEAAQRAHQMPDALCNNRFVKIVWASYDMPEHKGSGRSAGRPQHSNASRAGRRGRGGGSHMQQHDAWQEQPDTYPQQQSMSTFGIPQPDPSQYAFAPTPPDETSAAAFAAGGGLPSSSPRGRGRRARGGFQRGRGAAGRGSKQQQQQEQQQQQQEKQVEESQQQSGAGDLKTVQQKLKEKEAEAERIRKLLEKRTSQSST